MNKALESHRERTYENLAICPNCSNLTIGAAANAAAVGRCTASAIASASRKSFLWLLMNGFTNCAGISLTCFQFPFARSQSIIGYPVKLSNAANWWEFQRAVATAFCQRLTLRFVEACPLATVPVLAHLPPF